MSDIERVMDSRFGTILPAGPANEIIGAYMRQMAQNTGLGTWSRDKWHPLFKRGSSDMEIGRIPAAATLTAVLFCLVLLMHGALPGLVNDPSIGYLVEGSMTCLKQMGFQAITARCNTLGEPFGYPFLSAGPFIALGAVLMYLPGVGSGGAHMLAWAIFLALAMGSGFVLMRRLGAGSLVALVTSFLYLVTPTVVGMRGFLGTSVGYVLLPGYVLADLYAIEAAEKQSNKRLGIVFVGYSLVKILAAFMDGYSFVASSVVSALLWLGWVIRSRSVPQIRRFAGPGMLVGASLLAYVTYSAYVPAGLVGGEPIQVFRSMGLDLVTLVAPSRYIWPAAALDYDVSFARLWGDGTNLAYNYVGFGCLILAAACLWLRRRDGRVVALAVAGLLALVLSFGPALKVAVDRGPAEAVPSYETYLMPQGLAPEMPWSSLFTLVPGLNSMRASYRWFGITRLVLVLLAGLSVALLVKSGGRTRVLVLCLAAAAVVEMAPNAPLLVHQHRTGRAAMEAVTREVGHVLRDNTREGERVFFLNYDGEHNDWLAHYLAPLAGLRAYNAGGDKNALLAANHWPDEIKAMAGFDVGPDDVMAGFEAGNTDVVIAPYFHLRRSTYQWPPSPAEQDEARLAFTALLDDPRFEVSEHRRLAIIRPVDQS